MNPVNLNFIKKMYIRIMEKAAFQSLCGNIRH